MQNSEIIRRLDTLEKRMADLEKKLKESKEFIGKNKKKKGGLDG